MKFLRQTRHHKQLLGDVVDEVNIYSCLIICGEQLLSALSGLLKSKVNNAGEKEKNNGWRKGGQYYL